MQRACKQAGNRWSKRLIYILQNYRVEIKYFFTGTPLCYSTINLGLLPSFKSLSISNLRSESSTANFNAMLSHNVKGLQSVKVVKGLQFKG